MDLKVGNIKVIDALWFNKFGFVKGIDLVTNEIKLYAGLGDGQSEIEDKIHIIKYGHKLTGERLKFFIKWLEVSNETI